MPEVEQTADDQGTRQALLDLLEENGWTIEAVQAPAKERPVDAVISHPKIPGGRAVGLEIVFYEGGQIPDDTGRPPALTGDGEPALHLLAFIGAHERIPSGNYPLSWSVSNGEAATAFDAPVTELVVRVFEFLESLEREEPPAKPEKKASERQTAKAAEPAADNPELFLKGRKARLEKPPPDEPSEASMKKDAEIPPADPSGDTHAGDVAASGRLSITAPETGDIPLHDDGAERDHDSLNRATLALSFAWRLHEIWCQAQGLQPRTHLGPWRETDSFVAHVDAPWGGGKTTFANFVARILNPHLDGRAPGNRPRFLKELYGDRTDLSGLFLSRAHELGRLKPDGRTYDLPAEGRCPWIIVHYNAWLHEQVSPPWWCFYQKIRKSCFTAIRRQGRPEVRQGRGRSDLRWWDRVVRFLVIDRRFLPDADAPADRYHTDWEGWTARRLAWLGLWLRELWWRVWNPFVRMRLWAALLTASIILVMWRIDALALGQDATINFNTATSVGLAIALLASVGSFIWSVARSAVSAVVPGDGHDVERASLGPGDPLGRFRRHFGDIMRQLRRPVLVIIDDIDRCRHETVVDMIRGLQTVLRSRRVVYLMLGDRQWIEKSFETGHAEMNGIDVGPEHTFGGRFVEKAIQLSYVLPGMSDDTRRTYLREMLLGPAAADNRPDTVTDDRSEEDYRAEVRAGLAGTESVEDIEERARELEKAAKASGSRRRKDVVRQEKVLRQAAEREKVAESIGHRLEPLAPHLPLNPREIKRIVNTIAMYHESLSMTETEDIAIGDERWRQMAIGIVLMMRFPRSWARMVAEAEQSAAGGEDVDPDGADVPPLDAKTYSPEVAKLITGTQFGETTTSVDARAVRWLHRLIPVAGLARRTREARRGPP